MIGYCKKHKNYYNLGRKCLFRLQKDPMSNSLLRNRRGLAIKVAIPQAVLMVAYLASQNVNLLNSSNFFNDAINAGLGWAFMSVGLLYYTLLSHIDDGYDLVMEAFENGFAQHSDSTALDAEKTLKRETQTLKFMSLSSSIGFAIFLIFSLYQVSQEGTLGFINHAFAFAAVVLSYMVYVFVVKDVAVEDFAALMHRAQRHLNWTPEQFRIVVAAVVDHRLNLPDVLAAASTYVERYSKGNETTKKDFADFMSKASEPELRAIELLVPGRSA